MEVYTRRKPPLPPFLLSYITRAQLPSPCCCSGDAAANAAFTGHTMSPQPPPKPPVFYAGVHEVAAIVAMTMAVMKTVTMAMSLQALVLPSEGPCAKVCYRRRGW